MRMTAPLHIPPSTAPHVKSVLSMCYTVPLTHVCFTEEVYCTGCPMCTGYQVYCTRYHVQCKLYNCTCHMTVYT